jgi:hypothetical protein
MESTFESISIYDLEISIKPNSSTSLFGEVFIAVFGAHLLF